MKGNNWQKAARLMGSLAWDPKRIPVYLSQSIGNQTPLELRLPWIAFSAIEFLEDYLTSNQSIAEFGGGGSRLFFAQRVKKVLCIESSHEWAAKISDELDRLALRNVVIEVCPFDPLNVESYRRSSNVHRIDNDKYDIILVDGYE